MKKELKEKIKELNICIILIIFIISGFMGFLSGFSHKLLFENQRLGIENTYWQGLTNRYINANSECEDRLQLLTP